MSDADRHPEEARQTDADAWAAACEEDLAAERSRRAGHGPQPVNAAEELRRLADAVTDGIGALGKTFGDGPASTAAQGAAREAVGRARSALEPVVERNPQVFGHLAAAGGELLAACHAAVQGARETGETGKSSGSARAGDEPRDDGPPRS